jgi:hypothetical protein
MKPETRIESLMALLGWQGGTVHDVCAVVGLDVNDFLYTDFSVLCHDFQRGYKESGDLALYYLSTNNGNLQYWFGVISAIQTMEGD